MMPRSDQDAVPAFPHGIPILAEVIDFVFSDRSYSAFPARYSIFGRNDVCPHVFVLFLARSVLAKSRTRPFRPLYREIGVLFLVFLLSLRSFLFRCCPYCLSEPHRASTCSVLLPPRSVFHHVFVRSKCSVPSPWVCPCVSVPGAFSQWYIA